MGKGKARLGSRPHVTLTLGPNCEINLDDCASNPCDSGTCLDKIDGYECACEPGYTGEWLMSEVKVNPTVVR